MNLGGAGVLQVILEEVGGNLSPVILNFLVRVRISEGEKVGFLAGDYAVEIGVVRVPVYFPRVT